MKMSKAILETTDPRNNEKTTTNVEADAICVVSVSEEDGEKISVGQSVMGMLSAGSSAAMVEGLMDAVKVILDSLHPEVARAILSHMMDKVFNKK